VSEPYHHGDLRRALLDEAAAVLEEKGVVGLSLRDLARRAGVSPTAPYHHFRDKAHLIGELALDTLGDLDVALAEADALHSEPEEQLRAQGVAYVLFAADHPERFRLAFRPEMGDPFSGLADSESALPEDLVGFRHLVRAVRRLVAEPARQSALAIAAWSLVHGLAALLVDGPLRPIAADREKVRALALSATAHFHVGNVQK
jgi:AcrR family transcriptional regulator